jgi:phospholipid-binding lipoprotein MlaA
LRDTAGYVVDIGLDPLTYFFANPANKAQWYGAGRTVLEVIDTRSRIISVTDDLERNSLDYYTSMKSFYLQHRADEVRNGRAAPGETDQPSFPGQVGQE